MNLSLTLGTVKIPSGTPHESATGFYDMLDVEEVLIHLPNVPKPMDPVVKPQIDPFVKPALVPPPLMMGKIPSAVQAAGPSQSISQSNPGNIIVAEPVMRDLQKDLVTMVPSSVRRAQSLDHQPKKQKVSKEDEYEKFMAQFE